MGILIHKSITHSQARTSLPITSLLITNQLITNPEYHTGQSNLYITNPEYHTGQSNVFITNLLNHNPEYHTGPIELQIIIKIYLSTQLPELLGQQAIIQIQADIESVTLVCINMILKI